MRVCASVGVRGSALEVRGRACMYVGSCVRACVCTCVCACVRACVRARACACACV